jgi:hypothetical protein
MNTKKEIKLGLPQTPGYARDRVLETEYTPKAMFTLLVSFPRSVHSKRYSRCADAAKVTVRRISRS